MSLKIGILPGDDIGLEVADLIGTVVTARTA